MCFKGFSIFSSGRHSILPSRTILAILVEGHWRNTSVQYFEIRPLAKDEMSFEDFLFLALAAILFNGTEPFSPSWISDRHNFSLFRSRSHPAATEQVLAHSRRTKIWEEMSKIDFQDGSYGGHLGFSIGSFVSTKRPNSHHQV